MELLYAEETYRIIGACFEVYKRMDCGFLEHVYHECLKIEFDYQNISNQKEHEIKLFYRNRELEKNYRADFSCFDKIIIEVKAVSNLTNEHKVQIINYLNATGYKVGLLVNFDHHPKLEYERFVHTNQRKDNSNV